MLVFDNNSSIYYIFITIVVYITYLQITIDVFCFQNINADIKEGEISWGVGNCVGDEFFLGGRIIYGNYFRDEFFGGENNLWKLFRR